MFKKLKKVMFSPLILNANATKRIAYLGVTTALCVVANTFLEINFSDVQFSLTIYISICMGIILGPLCGMFSCFLGDAIGYMFNSMGYLYMFWVGLSTSVCAFIAGLIFYGLKFNFKGGVCVKLSLISLLSFFVCTVGINSTGFYFYNLGMGFSKPVIDYVSQKLGGEVTFIGYVLYRLIFKGQIYNSIVNYALAFLTLPFISRIKFFNLRMQSERVLEEKNVRFDEENRRVKCKGCGATYVEDKNENACPFCGRIDVEEKR